MELLARAWRRTIRAFERTFPNTGDWGISLAISVGIDLGRKTDSVMRETRLRRGRHEAGDGGP